MRQQSSSRVQTELRRDEILSPAAEVLVRAVGNEGNIRGQEVTGELGQCKRGRSFFGELCEDGLLVKYPA